MRIPLIALFAAVIVACGGQPADESADARDVTLTPAPPAQADLNDAPPPTKTGTPPATTPPTRPAPTRPTTPPPTTTPPPAGATMGTIAAGTDLAVLAASRICTNTHKVGDRFDATIADAVAGTGGASIPAGAKAVVEVTEATVGFNDERKVRLAFRVVSVTIGKQTYDLTGVDVVSAPVQNVRRQSTGEQAGKVATGAVVGAVVGRVVGGDKKGAVAGAAAGAVGGAVVAAGTADYDGCVGEKARLVAKRTQPLRIVVSS